MNETLDIKDFPQLLENISDNIMFLVSDSTKSPTAVRISLATLKTIFQTIQTEPEEIDVTSITLSGNSTGQVGATIQLSANIIPSNATNKTLTWSSSNTGIASVNQSGVVTLISSGTVTITATSASNTNIKSTKTITVSNPTPINYMYYGFYNDGQTDYSLVSASSIITAVTSGSVIKTELSTLGKTAVSNMNMTDRLIILIPQTSSLTVLKDDGFGGKVLFQETDGMPNTASNGEYTTTIDGVIYKVYGEFVVGNNTELFIYIQ